jgi:hypothetical protein
MVRYSLMALALAATVAVTPVPADDAADVKLLKAKVEALEAKLEAANLKIEKLQKENEELKAGGAKAAKPSGTDKGEAGANPKAMLGEVEYELLQCVRDPKKKTQVAFTFGLKSEQDLPLHFVPHQLSLTDGDGAAMDVKVVKGLPLKADFIGVQRAAFNIPKGQVIKFQIVVEGVKEGVTMIDRAELTAPARGFVTDRVTFTGVKVASKK